MKKHLLWAQLSLLMVVAFMLSACARLPPKLPPKPLSLNNRQRRLPQRKPGGSPCCY